MIKAEIIPDGSGFKSNKPCPNAIYYDGIWFESEEEFINYRSKALRAMEYTL